MWTLKANEQQLAEHFERYCNHLRFRFSGQFTILQTNNSWILKRAIQTENIRVDLPCFMLYSPKQLYKRRLKMIELIESDCNQFQDQSIDLLYILLDSDEYSWAKNNIFLFKVSIDVYTFVVILQIRNKRIFYVLQVFTSYYN